MLLPIYRRGTARDVVVLQSQAGMAERNKFEPKGLRADDVTPVGITMTQDGKTAFVALGRANHVAETYPHRHFMKNISMRTMGIIRVLPNREILQYLLR